MYQVKDHAAKKCLVKNQQVNNVKEVLDMYHPAEALLADSEKPENCLRDSYGQAGAELQLESATLAVGTHCNWEGY